MRRLLLILCCSVCTTAVSAQDSLRTVTVQGEGSATSSVDRAVITFGVMTQSDDPDDVFSQNARKTERVVQLIRELGVAERYISLENLHLSEDRNESDRRGGYVARRMLRVTIDDIDLVPELVARAVAEGVNQYYSIEYGLQDPAPLEDEALDAAMIRAREKAERLAARAGLTVGPVVGISERGVAPARRYANAIRMEEYHQGAYPPGRGEVRAFVVVTYELKRE